MQRSTRSTRGKIRLAILYLILGIVIVTIVYLAWNKVKNIIYEAEQGSVTPTVVYSPTNAPTSVPTVKPTDTVSISGYPTPAISDPTKEPKVTATPTATQGIYVSATPTVKPTGAAEPTGAVKPTEGVKPTEAVKPTGIVEVIPTPVPGTYKEAFIDGAGIQYEILRYVLYTSYGATVKSKTSGKEYTVGPEDLKRVLIDEGHANECKRIPLSEVSIGDIGYSGKAHGVCVGFDNGHPIFAYCSEFNISQVNSEVKYGAFLGYVMNDCDELYCGSYPLPVNDFYDCAYGGSNDFYIECLNKWFNEYGNEPCSLIHNMARAMYSDNVKLFEDSIFMEEIEAFNLMWRPGYPEQFFHAFLEHADADDYKRYSFLPTGYKYNDEKEWHYTQYRCSVVSLDPETFMDMSGEWWLTIVEKEDGSIHLMPHSRLETIREQASLFGLTVKPEPDENGEVPTEEVSDSAKNGDIVDDSGTQYLKVNDTTTITLGDGSKIYASSLDMDSVCDLYQGAGYIINREKNAYFEGRYAVADNGDVTHLINGVWKDLVTDETVGFEDERITEYWYTYDAKSNSYECYFGKAKPEYVSDGTFPTGYLADKAFIIVDGKKAECEYDPNDKEVYWVLIQEEIVYEIKEIYNELYVVSPNLEEYAKGRTVSIDGIDGICYKLIPEGEKKDMYLCMEYYTRLPVDGTYKLKYDRFNVVDMYGLNKYSTDPQERTVSLIPTGKPVGLHGDM